MDPKSYKPPWGSWPKGKTLTMLIAAAILMVADASAGFLPAQSTASVTGEVASQNPQATATQKETGVEAAPAEAGNPVGKAPDPAPALAEAVPADAVVPVTEAPATAEPPAGAAAEGPPPEAVVEDAGGGLADANEYVVVAGDTVSAIASRLGVDVYGMLAASGFGLFTTIWPGQTLKLSGPPLDVPAGTPAAPAPAAQGVPVPAAPAVRTIFVAGSGGQAMVDSCIGPIHFTPTDAYTLFITEHDFCGGWARFFGIGVGETVSIAGYGTYTATGRGQVPQLGTTDDVAAVFGSFPRAILQTCIPGTNQMLLIALN
jgi:LysM repeat protein